MQPMWENGYKNLNTSFYEQLENVYNHIIDNDYDNLIITNFEAGFNLEDEQNCLKQFVYELQDYIYGWELNEQGFTDDEIERIEDGEIVASESGVKWGLGGDHSEIVLIDEWMFNLEGEIHLCGAFDGECIEDVEIALTHANVDFKRVESLII